MKLFKVLGIVILSAIIFVCLGLDGWYIYLHYFGEEKTVNQTVIVSDMTVSKLDEETGVNIEDTRVFAEFNVFDNVIEIKFNYFMNENATDFYSQGIQLIMKDDKEYTVSDPDAYAGSYSKEIYKEIYRTDRHQHVGFAGITVNTVTDYLHRVLGLKNYYNFDLYEYQSYDNFSETSLNAVELQNGNEKFFITFGGDEEVYGLTFKDYDTKYNTEGKEVLDTMDLSKVGYNFAKTYEEEGNWKNWFSPTLFYEDSTYYRAFDLYYFIESMAHSLSSLNPSSNSVETYVKMPDIFDFYSIDENHNMTKLNVTEDESVRLYSSFATYFKVKLKVNSGDMTKASQSLFNTFAGSMSFDSEPEEDDLTDYVNGKVCINATLDDLIWISTDEVGVYKFQFTDEFISYWKDYKNRCYIRLILDLDRHNIEYDGFINNEDFIIYEILKPDGSKIASVEVANV